MARNAGYRSFAARGYPLRSKSSNQSTRPPMELLERDDALEKLRACMAATTDGVGRVVLVAGEAGIGKTSLLRELAAGLAPESVWWGSCDALQVPDPLAPLHDIARSTEV